MAECVFDSVEMLDSSKILPKIGSFQNGKLQFNDNLDCSAFSKPKSKSTILTVASDRLLYKGEEEDQDDELYYSLIAIRNKRTNKVRLVPVSNVSLNVCITKTNEILDNTINKSNLSTRKLYKEFGSKKSKTQTEQLEKMKVDVSHAEQELKAIADEMQVDVTDLNTSITDDSSQGFMPIVNRNASTVDKVYDLYSIISKSELDSLKKLAQEVKEKHVISESLTPFALDSINILSTKSSTPIEKYEILLYIDAILKFFKTSTRDLNKKKMTIGIYPTTIVDKILADYTMVSENHRTRPLSMRDKAACFVIVLSLIALNYHVNLEGLAKSISVGIKKLGDIGRVVGAQPSGSKDKTSIVLRLPLALPVKPFKSKKK